jgi:DNA-binding GntR family transcriptional regulator
MEMAARDWNGESQLNGGTGALLRGAPPRIVRHSLSQQAAEAIKARIYALDLPPGVRLVVDNLAENLGVSRTPVREALQQLVSEGLVRYDGNSYFVTSYGRKDVEELFAIRRALEALAAGQAAERISPQALFELRQLCDEGVERMAAGDTEALISLDVKFHGAISQESGNERLQGLLESMREQSWLIRRWGFLHRLVEYVEAMTLEEHRAIIERLAERDSAGASRLMEEHLRKGQDRTLEGLGL